ncbi:putative gustatory receptor 28a [Uranotaenia lowii]|uniref:putative gustatory receptor 28a n=1 Tax=Uranotaenia lowii TaxID=190385 RepID=UPI00247A6700|nr:putative gustatory receptor 28a [Uranotaenia lowii]
MMKTLLYDMLHPKTFYAAQRPILRMTFICGMTPFTVMMKGKDAELRSNSFGYFNTSIHTIIFCTCYVISLVKKENITGYFFSTEISTLGNILQVLCGLVALVMTFFYSIFQRKHLINAFHALARTDESFKNIGVETNYRSTLMYHYLIILGQLLVQGSFMGVSLAIFFCSGVYPCLPAWTSFFLPSLMISLVIVMFLSLVNQIKHRFHLLNKVLISLREICLEKKEAEYNEKQDEVKILTIRNPLGISSVYSGNTNRYMPDVVVKVAQIQDELCDACANVENYFNIQMLAIVAIAFLIGVFDTYYILETIFANSATNTVFSKLQFVAFFFGQAMVNSFGIMTIVYVSSLATKENDKIAVNVHKLMNLNHFDEDLVKQLTNFSLQLTHRKVAFTAYGFFNLDFTLLFTLTGAATTYLVILVQFTLSKSATCHHLLQNASQTVSRNESEF